MSGTLCEGTRGARGHRHSEGKRQIVVKFDCEVEINQSEVFNFAIRAIFSFKTQMLIH